MTKTTLGLIALCLLPTLACDSTPTQKKKAGKATPGMRPAPRPSERIYPCALHTDCVLSHRKDGKCCDVCALRAVHRNQLKDIEAQGAGQCGTERPSCPKLECGQPKGEPTARCEDKRCTVHNKPIR